LEELYPQPSPYENLAVAEEAKARIAAAQVTAGLTGNFMPPRWEGANGVHPFHKKMLKWLEGPRPKR